MFFSEASTKPSTVMTRIASPPTVLGPVQGPESCEMCGIKGLRTELVRDPFIYGSGSGAVELVADVPVHTCSECAVSFTGDAAEARRHEAICRHLGVLTADEIRAIRQQHGMSRAAFARLTGFGEASLARWERREVVQNRSNDRYLRLLKDPGVFYRLSSMVDAGASQTTRDSAEATMAVFVMIPSERQRSIRASARGWSPRRQIA